MLLRTIEVGDFVALQPPGDGSGWAPAVLAVRVIHDSGNEFTDLTPLDRGDLEQLREAIDEALA